MTLSLLALIFSACGPERVEIETGASSDTLVDQRPRSTAPPPIDHGDTGGSGAAERPAHRPLAEASRPLVDSAVRFIEAIGSGDSARFFDMLSARSQASLGTPDGGTRSEVWSAARATLKDLRRPQLSIAGGTNDSIAVLIKRNRAASAGRSFDDPGEQVVLHWVREADGWKAIYPGLSYPEAHLRP